MLEASKKIEKKKDFNVACVVGLGWFAQLRRLLLLVMSVCRVAERDELTPVMWKRERVLKVILRGLLVVLLLWSMSIWLGVKKIVVCNWMQLARRYGLFKPHTLSVFTCCVGKCVLCLCVGIRESCVVMCLVQISCRRDETRLKYFVVVTHFWIFGFCRSFLGHQSADVIHRTD